MASEPGTISDANLWIHPDPMRTKVYEQRRDAYLRGDVPCCYCGKLVDQHDRSCPWSGIERYAG